MLDHLVIVERAGDFPLEARADRAVHVVTAEEYITRYPLMVPSTKPGEPEQRASYGKVINLCRSYSYLSFGYYCALLAESRKDKSMPSLETAVALSHRSLYRHVLPELDTVLAKCLKRMGDDALTTGITLLVCFGRADYPSLQDLADRVYDRYRCPILTVKIVRKPHGLVIQRIRAAPLKDLSAVSRAFFFEAFHAHSYERWPVTKSKAAPSFHLAILHNPSELKPPSNRRALEKFIRVGASLKINVELIRPKDYLKVAEYDALFIRETTDIDNLVFRFAVKAQHEGMPVIDDPVSILRCCSKVFLADLLRENRVRAPRTVIFGTQSLARVAETLSFPFVLKIPNGSFSLGVKKVSNLVQFKAVAKEMLANSDVILAQEYLYTAFDWRIGILNRRPLYACKYMMAKNHWQVTLHKQGGPVDGAHEPVELSKVPFAVIDAALKAANLIGDGLYGVDLKETDDGVYVIEVNDNPNLDAGVEDSILKDELYRAILLDFSRRVESLRSRPAETVLGDTLADVDLPSSYLRKRVR